MTGEGTVRIRGHDLEYRWWAGTAGEGAPVLVLLHEGLGSVSTWRNFPTTLADRTGLSVMACSRYGYGLSTIRTTSFGIDYMHREARDALPALLEALGIERPILFGHSDGASIALIHAGLYPAKVRGLILEAPHVFTEAVCVEAIASVRAVYEASDELRARLGRHHADPERSFRGWNDVWLLPAFRDWNIEEYLPAIACPALVIQGQDDEYGTLAQVAAIERQSGGPVESLILDRCGHAPHRDREADVLDAVARFVATL